MRKVYFSWRPRRPALALLGLLGIGGALTLLLGAVIPEGGVSWKLWGFESRRFTVGEEEIELRLDTSGFGRYETVLEGDAVWVYRDDVPLLEGGFYAAEVCEDWMREARERGRAIVPEDNPLLLLDRDRDGYRALFRIEGSALGAAFRLSGDPGEEEALERAGRLRFTRRNP